MQVHVLRLVPGDDLRESLARLPAELGCTAACVLAAVGSFDRVSLRLAGASEIWTRAGDFELLTLSGTLSPDGPHLHLSVADAGGSVSGGHLADGCRIRTTAELVIGVLPDWHFARAPDPATGYAELVARRTEA